MQCENIAIVRHSALKGGFEEGVDFTVGAYVLEVRSETKVN